MDHLSEAKWGDVFNVYGCLATDSCHYVVLLNSDSTMYVPIPVPYHVRNFTEVILNSKTLPGDSVLGVYWTFASLLNAHGCQVDKISIEKSMVNGVLLSAAVMDVVQSNETGTLMSRIPLALWDIPVIALTTGAKIVVYETKDDPLSIKISLFKGNFLEIARSFLITAEKAMGVSKEPPAQGPFEG